MPRQILLPLVVAVNKLAELRSEGPFDWSAVDFVTDRNALRKLARWAKGTIKKNTSFRFDLQLAGESTILMSRAPTKMAEMLGGRFYRVNFEKAFTTTTPGCEGSIPEHSRVVTYVSQIYETVL